MGGALARQIKGTSMTGARDCFLVAFLVTLFVIVVSTLPGQDPLFQFVAGDRLVIFNPENGEASFPIDLSIVEDPMSPGFPNFTHSGFAMAIEVDETLLTIEALLPTGPYEFICGDQWEFFQVTLDPVGCPGVATVGILYGLACDVFPTFEVLTPMIQVHLVTVPSPLLGSVDPLETFVDFAITCGQNTILVGSGQADPRLVSGEITLQPVGPTLFVRGDCDLDGVLTLSDPIQLLLQLFLGATPGPCPAACAAEGSLPLDLGDGILLLQYLFQGGPPPPVPFPDCGTDPTLAPAECESFPACL